MKIFKFFISKIFLRRVILSIATILLVFMANYIIFNTARSMCSSFQGYQELKAINQKDTYIANIDIESDFDNATDGENETQKVFNYLNSNFKYAFYAGGYVSSLPNNEDMEIRFSYMNEEYYKLNKFKLSEGDDLKFDYQLNKDKEIPILVGKGLSETYPVGSTIKTEVPGLWQPMTLKVQGVLEENAFYSNMYIVSSKNYYNFAVFFPVNEEFINRAYPDLLYNGLIGMVVPQTTKEKVAKLDVVMEDNLGEKFDFNSQEENFAFFNEYYVNTLKIISMITFILLLSTICLSIWNVLVSIRLMLKDFTINLLVGLSYSKLRKILYSYFGILFFINLVAVFVLTAYSRHEAWLIKDSSFVVYGLFGLIDIDWIGLLAVLLSDIIIGIIIVEIMMKKIKKIPISLGVLQ